MKTFLSHHGYFCNLRMTDHELLIRGFDNNFSCRYGLLLHAHFFQITGEVEEYTPVKEDDIQTVMEQTGCSKDEARKSLKEADGDLAQAILELQK